MRHAISLALLLVFAGASWAQPGSKVLIHPEDQPSADSVLVCFYFSEARAIDDTLHARLDQRESIKYLAGMVTNQIDQVRGLETDNNSLEEALRATKINEAKVTAERDTCASQFAAYKLKVKGRGLRGVVCGAAIGAIITVAVIKYGRDLDP